MRKLSQISECVCVKLTGLKQIGQIVRLVRDDNWEAG